MAHGPEISRHKYQVVTSEVSHAIKTFPLKISPVENATENTIRDVKKWSGTRRSKRHLTMTY